MNKKPVVRSLEMSKPKEPASGSIKGQLAFASRRDQATPVAELRVLKRDYVAAKLAEHIEAEVRKIPPLTDEQVSRISRAMRGSTASG